MGMFDNYDNISAGYVPDNMSDVPEYKQYEIHTNPVYIETNIAGKENYAWTYGDNFYLEFDVNTNLLVEENAIVFTEAGETPTTDLEGEIGQKAYNTVDIKSWILDTIDSVSNDGEDVYQYNWVETPNFMYPNRGTKPITLTPDLEDKIVSIKFLDWFNNEFYTEELNVDQGIINFTMTPEKSLQFIKGVYYLQIYIDNNLNFEQTCRVD